MTAVTITTFDYSQITDPQLADQVRNTAEEIVALRTGIERDFLLIGQHLLATKERLPHGQFMDWVEQACGFSQRSATRLMTVAREFGKLATGGQFGVSILEQFAASSDPQTALAEAEALAADGVPVTKAVAAGIRDEIASTSAQDSALAPEESAAPAEPAESTESAEPAPSLEADMAKVSAAFANGIPVKSIVMVRHLTGITDEIRLMAALNALCVRGELRSAGLTTYQRVAPTATLDGDALDEKICAWLSSQTEPQGALTIGSAVGAYATATKQALERLCEAGRVEVARAEYGTKYYRVTSSPAAPQPEAESVDTEADQEHLVQTSAPDEVPQRDIIGHIMDAVRDAAHRFRALDTYRPGYSITLGWLIQETGHEYEDVRAACNMLVGMGELWPDPDDSVGACYLLEAPSADNETVTTAAPENEASQDDSSQIEFALSYSADQVKLFWNNWSPQMIERALEMERAGKNRQSLIYQLERRLDTLRPCDAQPKDHDLPEPAESPDDAPGETVTTAAAAPEPQKATTITEERLAALAESAVAALRKHGEGMFYNELKHFVPGENGEVNRALHYGVQRGLLCKNNANYYSLPEFIERAQATMPYSAQSQLLMLLEAAKRAQNAARDVERFAELINMHEVSVALLTDAQNSIRLAADRLDRALKHLTSETEAEVSGD